MRETLNGIRSASKHNCSYIQSCDLLISMTIICVETFYVEDCKTNTLIQGHREPQHNEHSVRSMHMCDVLHALMLLGCDGEGEG